MKRERARRAVKCEEWRVLDLFSGCGGLATGFRHASESEFAKFKTVGAMDSWDVACKTFTANHGIEATCEGVSRESVDRLLSKVGDVDVIAGGPPCQGFSTSGKRALDDARNSLVLAFLEAIRIANPRAFLMENVSGFTTFQNGRLFREVLSIASELGYSTFPGIVLSSLVGVPQRRRRFILVGLRSGAFRFPGQSPTLTTRGQRTLFNEAAHGVSLLVDQRPEDGDELWTFDHATSDLPQVNAAEESSVYASKPLNDYQAWARAKGEPELHEHAACAHRPYFVEMMSYIPQGRSGMDPAIQSTMPPNLRPKSGFPNSYARIAGDQPSPTITRNFTTPSSANCIHPRANRALTLREGARCQSFQDHYRFLGTHGEKRLMIGNAVPPLLAKALGVSLLEAFSSCARRV